MLGNIGLVPKTFFNLKIMKDDYSIERERIIERDMKLVLRSGAIFTIGESSFSSKRLSYKTRLFIIRTSEHMGTFSKRWMNSALIGDGYNRFDLNLPKHLPDCAWTKTFQVDPPLTEIGLRIAGLIGQGIHSKGIRFDAVYSCPTLRCTQTAQKIIEKQNDSSLTIFIEPMLYTYRKHQFGERIDFLTIQELKKNNISVDMQYKSFIEKEDADLLSSENSFQLQQRCNKALNRIVQDNKVGSDILIVTHSGNMEAMGRAKLSKIYSTELDIQRSTYNYPYCALMCISYTEESGEASWGYLANVLPPLTCSGFSNKFNYDSLFQD